MNTGSFKIFFTVGLLATASVFSYVTHAELVVSPITPQTVIPASQIPSDTSLEKLMVVQQFDKSLENSNKQAQAMIAQTLQKTFATMPRNQNLTPEQNVKFQQLIQNFIQDTLKEQNSPENRLKFKNAFIASAKATYTQQEVDAMIAFYGSPIGQKITNKQSQFNLNYMQKALAIIQEQQQELLKNKLPTFLKEMEKITGKSFSQ